MQQTFQEMSHLLLAFEHRASSAREGLARSGCSLRRHQLPSHSLRPRDDRKQKNGSLGDSRISFILTFLMGKCSLIFIPIRPSGTSCLSSYEDFAKPD